MTSETQAELWNGQGGNAWVDLQAGLDTMFRGFEDVVVDVAAGRVLDVGCGTGATTLAVARALGSATGIDLSVPMLGLARERAAQEGLAAEFLLGDAQEHPFADDAFDTIVSRFGVMFFADPVAAFANLARAGSDLAVIAWRSPQDNPFMTAGMRAVKPLVPPQPPYDPEAPGQFGFADRDRVAGILATAGWAQVDIAPLDVPCALPVELLESYITRLGPIGRILPELEPALRPRVVDAALEALASYVDGDQVRFTAACWLIRARS